MLVDDDLDIKNNKMYASIAIFALRYYLEQITMCYNAIDYEYMYIDQLLTKRLYTIDQALKLSKLRIFYNDYWLILKKYYIWLKHYL